MFNGIYTLEIAGELIAVRGTGNADIYDIAEERINALDDDYWAMIDDPDVLVTSYNPEGEIIWQEAWSWDAAPGRRGYWMDAMTLPK